ncbi:HAD-IIB family hydrolase [Kiloniella sp. b19]|uniref:HAD-IIB family hydrolase n=1 Tax=Kiloniella sp. GXU_MW_B19 TaxID=3141326 RepID=UPI0031E27E40
MRPIKDFSKEDRQKVRYLLSDIDDTITSEGRLTAEAYQALEDLKAAGFVVVPITGRPAGWCDHFCRMWPVDAIVGENGAFYFRYDHENRKMVQRYWKDEETRKADRLKLDQLRDRILDEVPGCALASDQNYRDADLAIDFCEDVPPLPREDISRIVSLFEEAGAVAKVSSIHVNGWFGNYDKLSMTRLLFREVFGEELETVREEVAFSGDSPNDAPMFGFFPHSVGVANVRDFEDQLAAKPGWITEGHSGTGFVEMARLLIKARKPD